LPEFELDLFSTKPMEGSCRSRAGGVREFDVAIGASCRSRNGNRRQEPQRTEDMIETKDLTKRYDNDFVA